MNRDTLYYLKLENVPILEQLQLEEALLRSDHRNWCLINEGSPEAIVMGISGIADELICSESFNENPIPVIRRFSGGGTVVVDEKTLFITLICNQKALNVPPFPIPILDWNGKLYKQALQQCDFQIKENDYTIGTKKFGGNAQYIAKERWLHHTSLIWDYNPQLMKLLKIPRKTPAYREKRNHEEFLCKLKEVIPEKASFYRNFLQALEEYFELYLVTLEEAQRYLKADHRKSTSLIWNKDCRKGSENAFFNMVC